MTEFLFLIYTKNQYFDVHCKGNFMLGEKIWIICGLRGEIFENTLLDFLLISNGNEILNKSSRVTGLQRYA